MVSWIFLGDVIYFNILGQYFMILNSLKTTTKLFERRFANYSDKTRIPMLVELYVLDPFYLENTLKFLSFTEGIRI